LLVAAILADIEIPDRAPSHDLKDGASTRRPDAQSTRIDMV
jgi:hypothetical protein